MQKPGRIQATCCTEQRQVAKARLAGRRLPTRCILAKLHFPTARLAIARCIRREPTLCSCKQVLAHCASACKRAFAEACLHSLSLLLTLQPTEINNGLLLKHQSQCHISKAAISPKKKTSLRIASHTNICTSGNPTSMCIDKLGFLNLVGQGFVASHEG